MFGPKNRWGRAGFNAPTSLAVMGVGLALLERATFVGWTLVYLGLAWLVVYVVLEAISLERQFGTLGKARGRLAQFFTPRLRRVLVVWLYFYVAGGVFPFILDVLTRAIRTANHGGGSITSHGALFLAAAVLCFVGVGQIYLYGKPTQRRIAVQTAALVSTVAALNTEMFALTVNQEGPSPFSLSLVSVIMYAMSALCTLACILVSEGGLSA